MTSPIPQKTIDWFGGNDQRAKVFLDRYALKDTTGEAIESLPVETWKRVANAIGSNNPERKSFYNLLQDFKFVPGGRILSGAGSGTEVTFYNCYVIPVETKLRRQSRGTTLGTPDNDPGADSREAIFDTIGLMVDIMSRGGGVGINWSVLRPEGAHLKRINGTTSGPVSWMNVASQAVGTVEQGGSRRGAAMFMLDDWHPDVLRFINAKRNLDKITNANVSVAVSNKFMDAVKADHDWAFFFPDTTDQHYNSEWDGDIEAWAKKGYEVVEYDHMPAREIWRKLAESAWDNGEPGVVFLERYNDRSTAGEEERIICVNPCGEQGLGAYSVCNLGAMNLSAYVVGGITIEPELDWAAFEKDVRTATRFLDRIIDENFYFLPENEKIQKDLRRIGLGVMGLADALVKLGLRYGSSDAQIFTAKVFRTMKLAALTESTALAHKLGAAPVWNKAMLERPYLQGLPSDLTDAIREQGLRNLFLLTQAPTGTTSILAGVNSGIEPFFALGYWREDRTGKHWVQPRALDAFESDFANYPWIVTANDVTVEEHVAMQAAVQKYVDSSVSKTINAPNSHTIEDVEKAFTLAYDQGLKGVAYFRDGCGRAQVLYTAETKQDTSQVDTLKVELEEALARIEILVNGSKYVNRPDVLVGTTQKIHTKSGSAYVTVNRDQQGREAEVFVSIGKTGSDMMELGEAIGRLASLAIRHGASVDNIADQLEGIGGHTKISFSKSLPHALSEALRRTPYNEPQRAEIQPTPYTTPSPINGSVTVSTSAKMPDGWTVMNANATLTSNGNGHKVADPMYSPSDLDHPFNKPMATATLAPIGSECPSCHDQTLVKEEGCKMCHSCGYSAC